MGQVFSSTLVKMFTKFLISLKSFQNMNNLFSLQILLLNSNTKIPIQNQ